MLVNCLHCGVDTEINSTDVLIRRNDIEYMECPGCGNENLVDRREYKMALGDFDDPRSYGSNLKSGGDIYTLFLRPFQDCIYGSMPDFRSVDIPQGVVFRATKDEPIRIIFRDNDTSVLVGNREIINIPKNIKETEVPEMEVSHLRIEKVENGFLYTLYEYDDESIPPGVRAQAGKIWVSGNDAAEIGRTVLKIFDANTEKPLTPKSEG